MKILPFKQQEQPKSEELKKRYRELPDKVKDNVVKYLRHCMSEVYAVLAFKSEYHKMLDEINPYIIFYINESGAKSFRIDDSDVRMGTALGHALAMAASADARIMEKAILKMVERNDGDERLKIK